MITKPMDILDKHKVRKTKKEKTAFIVSVQSYLQRMGYALNVEKGSLGSRNLVIGDPERATYLITAHYDTPASIGLPNFVTPCNFATFLLSQLLILVPFFLVAFLVGFLMNTLTQNAAWSFWAAYVAYFAMLFLMMFGPANRNNANDNTSGVVTVLEIMATLPENLRDRVCFVLFDLEEAGLIGSASYRKSHKKATNRQIVLNLDCVGDGDHIMLFPNKRLKASKVKMVRLRSMEAVCGPKSIRVHDSGFAYCQSDQKAFPFGVGIMAFHNAKGIGLYCDRIHTWRDTILEQTNVNILRAAIISYVGAADK